jgi:tryptophan-rich sensory protein
MSSISYIDSLALGLAVLATYVSNRMGDYDARGVTQFAYSKRDNWYQRLSYAVRPPPWLFAVAWFVVDAFRSTSYFLILQSWSTDQNWIICFSLMWVHMGLAYFWSIAFVALHSIWASRFDTLAFLTTGIVYTVYAWQISSTAGGLFIVADVWLAFATFLAFTTSEKPEDAESASKQTKPVQMF